MTGWLAASQQAPHLPILLVIGLAVVFGTVGARLFQKLRIPQVVGYIVIGIAVGRSGLGFIDEQTIGKLLPFNFFALGVIGFMIGGELHLEVFRKHGRKLIVILLAEGIGAFLCVGALVFAAAMLLTGDVRMSLALGLVLGAISSATAPAATVDVLWEYKTLGVLTTTVFALVALDDGLALALYGVASSVAETLTGARAGEGTLRLLLGAAYELVGAMALGAAAGFVLNLVLRWTRDRARALPFVIGSLALVIGLAMVLKVDLILATMGLGAVLTNLAPRRSNPAFQLIEGIAPPIYVLFFVVVGARLYVAEMAFWMWVLAGAYVVGRTAGKMVGAHLGARWSGAAESVRRYLGLCLFSQAGVAVGLAILASDRFGPEMGTAIITIVTATTFLVQVLGPPCVKLAVQRAGEVGLNVTEEDLLESHRVADMVDRATPVFRQDTPLGHILKTMAETSALTYPVLDADGRLIGLISIQELRRSMVAEQLATFLLAFDLMQPVVDSTTEGARLGEAVTKMREQDLDSLPVVASADDPRFVGMLELRAVGRALSREIIAKRQRAAVE
ncbi:MAG TPA: cation:proton antiporter [Phycisphaerae bacterium]|nr:cation:proton antiporter [Phycisphaerae bacterium]